jgi:hypothetical protein
VEEYKNMKNKKIIPLSIAGIILSVSLLSGCVGPWAVDTYGWDHINEEGTAVRIWGQLTISESGDNWVESFVWDTEPHDDWHDYAYFREADNHAGLGLFSLNIYNLSRTIPIHYRAVGEYTKGKSQFRWGVDNTMIPGGPRVATDNASNIGLTQATFKGNLWHMGGASSCTVYFLYGTDINSLNQQTTPETMTSTGLFSVTLSSLVTNTTYYYKAVAENDADTWSGVILHVTPGQPILVTRQAGSIGTDHATLKGELYNTGGTSTCNVWFVYSDIGPNQLNQSTTPQLMNTTGPFQAYIDGLKTSTKYWYRAIADNGAAQGAGDIFEFTTTPTTQLIDSDDRSQPYIPDTPEIPENLRLRLPLRFIQFLEHHPILLKLLQQPRFQRLLNALG